MKKVLLFFAVILLSFFLRFYNLSSFPPSLNWDEISLGYNAYSVLKTSRDEWGNFLPLSFKAYGDYKLPTYVYLDVPFISIFGLNAWGVRLPSAILGFITVILIYLILSEIKKEKDLAFYGLFLAATTPWLIILSRIALEANMALTLTTAFVYFLIKDKPNLILSSIMLGLSIFTYNSSRVVAPLLLILVIVIFCNDLKKRLSFAVVSLLIFIVFFFVAVPLALLQDSSARYKWTAILDQGAINQINESRGKNLYPPVINNLIFNKVTYFSSHAFANYISYFNPNFIFISGGSNYQFSVPGYPLVYPFLLPFLLYGVWIIFTKKDKRWYFILGWLLLSPIPAAITRDSPHALRSLMMISPMVLISSLGISRLITNFKKYRLMLNIIFIGLLFISLSMFIKKYTIDYPKDYSWAWQYGYQQALNYISLHQGQYSKIYITKKYGEPHEFLLFYDAYDPQKYRDDPNLIRYFQTDWYWVDGFDKYYFLNDWEVKDRVKCDKKIEKCLLITSPNNYPSGSKLLETINFLNQTSAFDIVDLGV